MQNLVCPQACWIKIFVCQVLVCPFTYLQRCKLRPVWSTSEKRKARLAAKASLRSNWSLLRRIFLVLGLCSQGHEEPFLSPFLPLESANDCTRHIGVLSSSRSWGLERAWRVADKAQRVASCSPQGDCIRSITQQGHWDSHSSLGSCPAFPPSMWREASSLASAVCEPLHLVTAPCQGEAVAGIFHVLSVCISDEVAREEMVVWLIAVDHRNVTAPPVVANEPWPMLS